MWRIGKKPLKDVRNYCRILFFVSCITCGLLFSLELYAKTGFYLFPCVYFYSLPLPYITIANPINPPHLVLLHSQYFLPFWLCTQSSCTSSCLLPSFFPNYTSFGHAHSEWRIMYVPDVPSRSTEATFYRALHQLLRGLL